MSQQAIVVCADPLQDRGQVVFTGESILTEFGFIQGTVCAYGVIHDPVTNNVFYLIENAPDGIAIGDGVRVRVSISG